MNAKKGKIWICIVVVCVLVLSGRFFFRAPEGSPNGSKPIRVDRDRPETISPEGGELIADRHIRDDSERNPKFAATLLSRPPDTEILNKIEYPKFSRAGSGTRGAIRDIEGSVILRATNESPVAAIAISPDDQLIWVSGGDRKSYIINSKGEEIANLPITPPGKDMLGFGKWVWLDNDRLLGESGVQKFDEHGKPVGCCQGHNVSESRFYVYDLRTNQMEEMQLPENLRGKAVSIGKALKTGELQLGHEGDGFGWYQVTDLEEKR